MVDAVAPLCPEGRVLCCLLPYFPPCPPEEVEQVEPALGGLRCLFMCGGD